MSTKFPSAVQRYCKATKHSKGTSDEYKATVRKWISWGQEIPLEQLSRSSIRDFLDWVYDDAVEQGGENPIGSQKAQKGQCGNRVRICLFSIPLNPKSIQRQLRPVDRLAVAGVSSLTTRSVHDGILGFL